MMEHKKGPEERIELCLTTSPVEAFILPGYYAAYVGSLLPPSRLNCTLETGSTDRPETSVSQLPNYGPDIS